MFSRVRNCLGWTLAIAAVVVAIPSQLLILAAETVGEWADGIIED